MGTRLFLFLLAGSTGALAWSSLLGQDQPRNESSLIRSVLDTQVRCWNKGDLDGFMDTYWRDENLTFYSGDTVTKGWQATRDRYFKRYKAEGKEMGTLAFQIHQVDQLGPADASVRAEWKLVTSNATMNGLFTLLLKKQSGKWVIVHDHTSVKTP